MNRIKLSAFSALLLLFSLGVIAENDSTWKSTPAVSMSRFVDVFYMYDLNQPDGDERQAFLYNHNRHNEFNLNLGLLQLEVEHSKYRANLAIQARTYAEDNYSAEQGLLKIFLKPTLAFAQR